MNNNKFFNVIVAAAVLLSVISLGLGIKIMGRLSNLVPVVQTSPSGQKAGAFISSGTSLTDLTITNDATVSGLFTSVGTTTLGYTTTQLNTPQVAFNAASTTVCSVQNNSGAARVVTGLTLDINAGTSTITVNSAWRAYASGGRADMNASATNTIFAQATINSSSLAQAFGGPVPGSYYVSSTAFLTGNSGVATTSPVIWPSGGFVNVTTTAITSSTGNCVIHSYPF